MCTPTVHNDILYLEYNYLNEDENYNLLHFVTALYFMFGRPHFPSWMKNCDLMEVLCSVCRQRGLLRGGGGGGVLQPPEDSRPGAGL